MSERWGGFSNEDKQEVRDRAGGKCDLSDAGNNNIVHHITGCYIGRLDNWDERVISDASLNASMLSDEMAEMHDQEEAYQVACLEYEKKGVTIYDGKKYEDPARVAKRNAHIQRSRKVFPQGSGRSRKSVLHWKRTTQSRRTPPLG